MKNIYDILKDFGLEIPSDKKADFDKMWKENYRTKSEYDNAVTKRDEYKASLDGVNAKLKEFEGVNVDELKGQIAKLQTDMATKEAEYARKESERQFNDTLNKAITDAGNQSPARCRVAYAVEGSDRGYQESIGEYKKIRCLFIWC